jgi:hypothetical protein
MARRSIAGLFFELVPVAAAIADNGAPDDAYGGVRVSIPDGNDFHCERGHPQARGISALPRRYHSCVHNATRQRKESS